MTENTIAHIIIKKNTKTGPFNVRVLYGFDFSFFLYILPRFQDLLTPSRALSAGVRLQVTISNLPYGSLLYTGGDFPCIRMAHLSLQMTLGNAC